MKKLIFSIGALIVVGFVITQAMAWNGYSTNGEYSTKVGSQGSAFSGCPGPHNGLDFRGHNSAVRSQIQSELARANPDMQKVGELRQQIAGHRSAYGANGVRHGKNSRYRGGHAGNVNCW